MSVTPRAMQSSFFPVPQTLEPGTGKYTVCITRAGFTLIEAMVSLLILSVILLGLQAGMMTTITRNTENLLRNQAVKLAQERMDYYRVSGTVSAPPAGDIPDENINRQVRNANANYFLDNNYDSSTNKLEMTVRWDFQNEEHSLQYTTYID